VFSSLLVERTALLERIGKTDVESVPVPLTMSEIAGPESQDLTDDVVGSVLAYPGAVSFESLELSFHQQRVGVY
jgi:hypothetical protein